MLATRPSRRVGRREAQPTPASSGLRRRSSIARVAHSLDRSVRPELVAQATDADVDDVGARVEVIAPDLREQALAADDLARVLSRKCSRRNSRSDRSATSAPIAAWRRARSSTSCPRDQDGSVPCGASSPGLHPDAGQQLVERERLGQVVDRTELEAAQLVGRSLRAERISTGGRAGVVELPQHDQAVEPGSSRSRMTRSNSRRAARRGPRRRSAPRVRRSPRPRTRARGRPGSETHPRRSGSASPPVLPDRKTTPRQMTCK